ncbi:hypothetical protein SAMN05428964_1011322 [Thalassospira xiamenensis]|uniref:Uncharacterized protein n=1 Tax=Thalassospira xiamenensis TaxID=220697 RepID=A0A285RLL1_9PROT|nr:hypothetical protein SAMN05428964_1011322 [Thalassospira xiamenensis]
MRNFIVTPAKAGVHGAGCSVVGPGLFQTEKTPPGQRRRFAFGTRDADGSDRGGAVGVDIDFAQALGDRAGGAGTNFFAIDFGDRADKG